MRLIVIRHAETDGNKHRFVGREDLPLNATGRSQAASLVTTLSPHNIDRIYASPLERAIETARPIATAKGLDVILRPELIEIDFGTLQGAEKGLRPLKLRRDHLYAPMPEGESLHDVWRRLGTIADELIADLTNGITPAIVGHYWSNRLLEARLRGVAFDQAMTKHATYKPTNASAYAMQFRNIQPNAPHLIGATWL
jgi:broad specificity phosphatase PhoE